MLGGVGGEECDEQVQQHPTKGGHEVPECGTD